MPQSGQELDTQSAYQNWSQAIAVHNSGLAIHCLHYWLGANPDGLVYFMQARNIM